MFSYYGSKSKIAKLYPKPRHINIIEPFAGSARYSLLHFTSDVRLYDVNPMIVEIWQYLISSSEKDILSLPDVPSKVSLDTFTSLAPVEKNLIGFHMCRGKAKPRKVGHGQNDWNKAKIRIADNLFKIKHWVVEQKSYAEIENIEATWFIDPPYQHFNTKANSDRYPFSEIDYSHLGKWTLERRGQVIACEGEGADYLPFKGLCVTNANTNNKGVGKRKELIFTR